ncbi:hypothetical protein CsSME_00021795 [Camellia sinensis var. sinensis]
MVVVGLHPNCDIQALQKQYFGRKSEGSGKFRSALSGQHQSRVEPNLEPQIIGHALDMIYDLSVFYFQVLLKYKDLLSFGFPGGVEDLLEKSTLLSGTSLQKLLLFPHLVLLDSKINSSS